MSISGDGNKLARPTNKYIKFKSGKFQYWSKEDEKNIEVPLPITFIVLDELATVVGWHDESQSAIYSNEVHSTNFEELNVKAFKGGDLAKGLYSNIKDTIKAKGGRYAKSVYAMIDGELVNLQFAGASLSAWIGKEAKGVAYKVTKLDEGKKGATTYKIPVFEDATLDLGEGDVSAAMELDKETLQPYLVQYKKSTAGESKASISNESPYKKDDVATVEDVENMSEGDSEDLPF